MLFNKFIIFWNSKIYHLFSTFPKRHHAMKCITQAMIRPTNPAKLIKSANPAKVIKSTNLVKMSNTKYKSMPTTNIQNVRKNSELPLSLASSACIL